MDTRGEAPPEARSCGERPSDESGEESGEETAEQPERATTFTLNGEVWTFENPVSIVLAAARQLGMTIRNDARLLWIADEALLDEYDEEQAAALTGVPEVPLSDEVCRHYADIFAARSKPVLVSAGNCGAPPASAPAVAPARMQRAGKLSKRERRRRRLVLREARLSGIVERYTEELAQMSDDSSEGVERRVSPSGSKEAVWPDDLTLGPEKRTSLSKLPRIDSLSRDLSSLDTDLDSRPDDGEQSRGLPIDEQQAHAPAAASSSAVPPLQGPTAPQGFRIGARVEVDFDDEGWIKGWVDSLRDVGGTVIYSVRLDDGETADDVEGSEIRTAREDEHEGSDEQQAASTRADGLSDFDMASFCSDEEVQQPELQVRVTSSGVEWSLMQEDQLTWSPPTLSLLTAHNAAGGGD